VHETQILENNNGNNDENINGGEQPPNASDHVAIESDQDVEILKEEHEQQGEEIRDKLEEEE
jgi:hypothetical protein